MISPADFRLAMRMLPGAVNLIVTSVDGRPSGMTATAVCSLCAEPPTLLICVNRSATSHEPIRQSGRFTVNLLSTEDEQVAREFSTGDMESRFRHGRWTELPHGGRTLDSALVAFDCRLIEHHPFATHTIFIGAIEALATRSDRSPLLYFDGRFDALKSRA